MAGVPERVHCSLEAELSLLPGSPRKRAVRHVWFWERPQPVFPLHGNWWMQAFGSAVVEAGDDRGGGLAATQVFPEPTNLSSL